MGKTTIIEPVLSRDHTERMLNFFGAKVTTCQLNDMSWKITLEGVPDLKPLNLNIPADPSSASFPIVSAIITPNSKIKVMNVCINELRIGLYKTLIEMGANIKFSNQRRINGELVADISASSSNLKGITVPKSRASSMIDEYPILSIAASIAKGVTVMEGVEELRYKETDRIKTVCEGLQKIGVATQQTKDSMTIKGKGPAASIIGDVEINILYRKVAYEVIKNNIKNSENLEILCCNFAKNLNLKESKNKNLRTEDVAKLASKIAIFPNLRKILNNKQKEFSNFNKKQFGGCILDGRDIGTTILPNADFKFFITASIEVRAKRRLLEKNRSFLHENDEKCMLHTLINDMKERDKLDSNRKTSPLVPAKDAYVIDTTLINSQELLLIVTNIIEGKNELLK